jgi:hypothetical protein
VLTFRECRDCGCVYALANVGEEVNSSVKVGVGVGVGVNAKTDVLNGP